MFQSLVPFSRGDFFLPINQEIDRMFNKVFGRDFLEGVKTNSRYPRLDVVESDGKLTIRAVVAGITKDDLEVEVSPDNVLTIAGKLSNEHIDDKDNYRIRELSSSVFRRQIRLPSNVVGDDPVAKLKDGILTLIFDLITPEKEKVDVKKIEVQSE
jgi:HSP20 family protein